MNFGSCSTASRGRLNRGAAVLRSSRPCHASPAQALEAITAGDAEASTHGAGGGTGGASGLES